GRDPGLFAHVLEASATQVVEQAAACALVRFGGAVRFGCAIQRTPEVDLRFPLHVIGDEEIELAVPIIVEPCGAGPKAGVMDSRRFGNIAELAIPLVVEQAIAVKSGDVDILAPV